MSQAIDVLDETGARVRLRESSILPEEAKEAQQKLKEVMGQKDRDPRRRDAGHGGTGLIITMIRS